MQHKITINAPAKKVWHTMLDHGTYEEWAKVFSPDSSGTYEGDWSQGSEIKFGDGDGNGMVGTVVESRPHEFVSIRMEKEIRDGKEQPSPNWAGAMESYTFVEKDGQTELTVDLTGAKFPPEVEQMFADMWPKGLERLKEISEQEPPYG